MSPGAVIGGGTARPPVCPKLGGGVAGAAEPSAAL
jgi:hypothetical protein